ncbi:hypothetical protein JZ751_027122 [Albula glossodonta]|uniref:Uncharacterized protein n=1 Tax=Albula glossodonta TaxID=121402 RepID=A0A8T2MXG7_9TELE|nr:hypothetical protein JZ751_027122 [Albula glossodonta]
MELLNAQHRKRRFLGQLDQCLAKGDSSDGYPTIHPAVRVDDIITRHSPALSFVVSKNHVKPRLQTDMLLCSVGGEVERVTPPIHVTTLTLLSTLRPHHQPHADRESVTVARPAGQLLPVAREWRGRESNPRPQDPCGGTVGAILTCPLEVVKTRLQSSSVTLYISEVQLNTVNGASVARVSPGPLHCLNQQHSSLIRLLRSRHHDVAEHHVVLVRLLEWLPVQLQPGINAPVICTASALTLSSVLILEKEGPRSLFRGLGPNLVGVAPSR